MNWCSAEWADWGPPRRILASSLGHFVFSFFKVCEVFQETSTSTWMNTISHQFHAETWPQWLICWCQRASLKFKLRLQGEPRVPPGGQIVILQQNHKTRTKISTTRDTVEHFRLGHGNIQRGRSFSSIIITFSFTGLTNAWHFTLHVFSCCSFPSCLSPLVKSGGVGVEGVEVDTTWRACATKSITQLGTNKSAVVHF